MKLFRQVRKLTIDKFVIDFNQLDFEFKVQATNDSKSDIATFTIYNLSNTTKEKLKKGQAVSLVAGYEELNGVIFNGVVEEISNRRNENDIATIIRATPNNFLYTNTIVNRQFKANIKASDVISLLSKDIPFKIDVKGLGSNITFPNGKVFSNRLSNVINVLARDTNSRVRVFNNTIEFTEKNKVYSSLIKLNASNGLVKCEKVEKKVNDDEKKEDKKEKYNVECLLIPIIQVNQLLEVESLEYKGKLVVKEVTYNATDINNFSVNAVCEVVK